MERRDFIKHTAAMASVAVTGITQAEPVAETAQNDIARCLVGAVLVDGRFSDSRRFASAFASHGVKAISLTEDIGSLWYGELRAQCLQSHSVIAGLTLHTDLFVSQQFAREFGKRFIQFGAHDCRGQSTLTHAIPMSATLDLRSRESWAEDVAQCMIDAQSFSAQRVMQATGVARSSDHPGSLYSWMIV
jgi:hypothetical protein